MPTVTFRSIIELSQPLARRVEGEWPASWPITNSDKRYVSVAAGTVVGLDAYTTYILSADPLASVVLGWILGGNTVEIPINGITIIAPPATPYLRNPALSGTLPVPVKVYAFQ